MPKIYLKPNSAEYADEQKQLREYACDMPGCSEIAEFKAPRDRALDGHYHFCLTHIQEYNKAWNFFSGMAQVDIEEHIVNSGLWDRPTWRADNFTNLESDLRSRSWQSYHFTDKKTDESKHKDHKNCFEKNTPEHEAMAIMGLTPPLELKAIKDRYKKLVKKHHPDINRDNPQSEELLKAINMAYTILKLAFEKYDKLEK